MSFTEAIAVDLQLTIDGAVTVIPGGHVKHFGLNLRRYGFTATAEFVSPSLYRADDALFEPFRGLAPVYVQMTIAGVHNLPDRAPADISVRGLVTEKYVVESRYGTVPDGDSYHRRYHIEFADIAQVLWPQHYPCVLVTDVTLSDVIDDQKPAGMTINYDWDALALKRDLVCLPLDADTSAASFYDFICWLVATQGGVLTYDGTADEYTLSKAKSRTASAGELLADNVASLRVTIPETLRHDVAVQNATAESSGTTAITQTQAATGVRHDMLGIVQVPADIDTRVALEKRRLSTRAPVLELFFASYPEVDIQPGAQVAFSSDTWSRYSSWLSSSYWVFAVEIDARASQPTSGHDLDRDHTAYETEWTVVLEEKAETYAEVPVFKRPRWPIFAEGKVISYGGGATDKTYYIVDDATTAIPMYEVQIPLWNKQVSAPYTPLGMPGHYHFPAFRDQRALCALYFFSAEIDRFLDYGARTQLTTDTQGNHILFGQNETSETSMRYAYEDDKSLFEVMRVMGGDHVSWQMKEGLFYLEVREDESEDTTEQTYDVQADVEAGKSELSSSVSGGISDLNSKFQSGSSEVDSSISGATADVGGALDDMDSAISSKISETDSAISDATAGLSSSASELSSTASAASSELLNKAQG